jgi:hypothetical protein
MEVAPMAASQSPGSWLEGRKLFFEALKHMTTLGTATVVLAATLHKELAQSRCLWLVGLAALLMTASAGLSLLVMVAVAGAVSRPPSQPGRSEHRTGLAFVVAYALFFAGLLAVLAFAVANFLR